MELRNKPDLAYLTNSLTNSPIGNNELMAQIWPGFEKSDKICCRDIQ